MTLALSSRLRIDPHVRFRRFEDEGVVIHQTVAEALVVNEVAVRLLEMTDGTRTLDECAALLLDEFDAPADELERDVLRFANDLVDAGVARPVEELTEE